jgi:hypothetical protein
MRPADTLPEMQRDASGKRPLAPPISRAHANDSIMSHPIPLERSLVPLLPDDF